MKLLFQQRIFSWFDSYDIYDENNGVQFVVKGRMAWGHRLEIYDAQERFLGRVQQEVLTLLPRFVLYEGEEVLGEIRKEFTLFTPKYQMDCKGWQIEGDWLGWDYQITDASGRIVATVSKQLWNFSDTYVLDVANPADYLHVLMVALAIDAANCDS